MMSEKRNIHTWLPMVTIETAHSRQWIWHLGFSNGKNRQTNNLSREIISMLHCQVSWHHIFHALATAFMLNMTQYSKWAILKWLNDVQINYNAFPRRFPIVNELRKNKRLVRKNKYIMKCVKLSTYRNVEQHVSRFTKEFPCVQQWDLILCGS